VVDSIGAAVTNSRHALAQHLPSNSDNQAGPAGESSQVKTTTGYSLLAYWPLPTSAILKSVTPDWSLISSRKWGYEKSVIHKPAGSDRGVATLFRLITVPTRDKPNRCPENAIICYHLASLPNKRNALQWVNRRVTKDAQRGARGKDVWI
jgi:hypothetical protein